MSLSQSRRITPEQALARIDEVLVTNARTVAEAERPLSGSPYMEAVRGARADIAARAERRAAARVAAREQRSPAAAIAEGPPGATAGLRAW